MIIHHLVYSIIPEFVWVYIQYVGVWGCVCVVCVCVCVYLNVNATPKLAGGLIVELNYFERALLEMLSDALSKTLTLVVRLNVLLQKH